MAICVYEHGNTTIRNGGDILDASCSLVQLEYADYNALLNQLPFGLPELSNADSLILASSTLLLWATSFVFRELRHST